MKTKPNIAIIRIPTQDDDLGTFVSFDIAHDGFIDSEGQIFTVYPGDSYLDLEFSQVVLAMKMDGQSTELCSFTIGDSSQGGDDPAPTPAHELGMELINDIIPYLVKIYMEKKDDTSA